MSRYWRHVTSVFTGSLVAQTIPIVGSLAVTRIFAPNEFGEFSTWLAIVAFVAVVVTLRLETVLAIVNDGRARAEAVSIVLVTSVCAMAVLAIGLFFLDFSLVFRSFFPKQSVFLVLVIPAALFFALNQVWQTWAAVEGAYWKLNTMRLVHATVVLLIQIGAGLLYPASISLVMGFTLACGVSFLVAVILMPKLTRESIFNFKAIQKFFKRYKKFPLYALPADSINTAIAQLPVLVVYHRFGAEAAGYLALTMRVLGAPVGLVGKAILDVFKRYAVQSIREVGNCRDIYLKTFTMLLLSSIVMVAGTVSLGEDIFRLAFGEAWVPSGQMAVWLLPMFALGLIASPLSYMVYLVEKQHVDLFWQIGLMVVGVAGLYGFTTVKSTLVGYAVGYSLMYIIYVAISYRLSGGAR